MDLTTVRAKIDAGMLPRQADDIAIRFVRYAPGVCAGCDVTFGSNDVGVQFDVGSGRCLLHVDCYVMWTEACAA